LVIVVLIRQNYNKPRLIRIFVNTGWNLLFLHLVIRIFLHFHAVVYLSSLTSLWKRLGSFQTQHKRNHDHQRAYRIMITSAATSD